tara:strand:+ start:8403 stop:8828 length:426 start_codon:yes stop_codon:yes gene_type:complete
MPVPFIKKHSEDQYLKLENNYLNLFNLLSSLCCITEGEDLNSNSQRLIHFNALCKRINEGVERFSNFTNKVQSDKIIQDSASLVKSVDLDSVILIWMNQEERELIIESLENYALMLNEYKISDKLNNLAKQIKELKNGKSK